MFRSGAFVADHVDPVDDEQIQPNGVDLTLDVVFEQRDPGRIGRDDEELGERQEIEVDEIGEHVPDTFYLPIGGYVVRFAETVSIPGGHVGFVSPRSTLLGNTCMLDTAVWDASHEGNGEGFLQVLRDIEIEQGARIGRLALVRTE